MITVLGDGEYERGEAPVPVALSVSSLVSMVDVSCAEAAVGVDEEVAGDCVAVAGVETVDSISVDGDRIIVLKC